MCMIQILIPLFGSERVVGVYLYRNLIPILSRTDKLEVASESDHRKKIIVAFVKP